MERFSVPVVSLSLHIGSLSESEISTVTQSLSISLLRGCPIQRHLRSIRATAVMDGMDALLQKLARLCALILFAKIDAIAGINQKKSFYNFFMYPP